MRHYYRDRILTALFVLLIVINLILSLTILTHTQNHTVTSTLTETTTTTEMCGIEVNYPLNGSVVLLCSNVNITGTVQTGK